MWYILFGILIFGFLIAVHELGHFLAARLCGVRVNEFSIGMGPTLFKKQGKETTYSLRLLPFGGFCAMEGEEEQSDDPAAMNNKNVWQKLLIFVAGAAMNFIAGLLILLILNANAAGFYDPTITAFAENCPLQSESGLQVGDRIVSINGEHVYVYSDIHLLFGLSKSDTYDLVVERNGSRVTLQDFTMTQQEYPSADGGTYTGFGLTFGVVKATFGEKIRQSWNNAIDFVRTVRLSLQMIFRGEAGLKDLSGPVGLVSTMSSMGQSAASTQAGIENVAYLGALIAVNLAVMNLLPLPALDGGKIFFLIINALCMLLFKKQIPEKYENYIHLVGFGLLMLLMVIVTFQDVWKLFQ
jgi:regulator of sigma E protease